jgi:hypothetical protein
MKICSECINASFSSSGVYCMALHVDIFDERVAEECGLFELPSGDIDVDGEEIPTWIENAES